MSKKKQKEQVVAHMVEALNVNGADEAAALAEVAAILEAEITEPTVIEVENIAAAIAEANGYVAPDAAVEAAEIAAAQDDANQAPVEAPKTFTELFDAVTEQQFKERHDDVMANFAERAGFEQVLNPANENIQKTLSKCIKGITPGIVKALVVAGVDGKYINESEVSGARRNVYALEKLRDVLYGAITGWPQNAVNKAIIQSMVRCHDVKLPFNGEVAKAAVSDKLALNPAYAPHMVRHTVAASTASTQMSSTMTALEVLGVAKNTGSRQHPLFEFTDTPLAQHLIAMVRSKMAPVATV